MRKNPLLKILRITDVNKVFGEITKYVDVIKFHTKWAGTILGGTSLRLPASNSALASREARRRIVPGSPGWTRTSDILVTEILPLPKGPDYLIASKRRQVYSLYTFMTHRLVRQ